MSLGARLAKYGDIGNKNSNTGYPMNISPDENTLAQGSSFDAMMSSGTKVKVGGERYGVTFVKPNKEDKKKKGDDKEQQDDEIPFKSTEWPPYPAHKPAKHATKGNLEPGDYGFENFSKLAKKGGHDLDTREANRRLTLPEYSSIHWDRKHQKLLGDLDFAWNKYRKRLIIEGVYELYPMYNGKKPSNLPPGAIIKDEGIAQISGGGVDNTKAFSMHYGPEADEGTFNENLSDVIGRTTGGDPSFGTGSKYNNPIGTTIGYSSGNLAPTNTINSSDFDRTPGGAGMMSNSSGSNLYSGNFRSGGNGSSSDLNSLQLIGAFKQAIGSQQIRVQSVAFIDSQKVSQATQSTVANNTGGLLK